MNLGLTMSLTSSLVGAWRGPPPAPLAAFSISGGLGTSSEDITAPSGAGAPVRYARYRVPAGAALNRANHFLDRTSIAAGATVSLVRGDNTRTNKLTNGTFAADASWTKGTGWTITGGKAVKAAGTASFLSQLVASITGGLTAGLTYRVAWTISAYVAGTINPRISGGAILNGLGASANGQFLRTMTPCPATPASYNFIASATTDMSIDDAILYEETGSCLPQGVWDEYAIPESINGVEGTPSIVTNVTII